MIERVEQFWKNVPGSSYLYEDPTCYLLEGHYTAVFENLADGIIKMNYEKARIIGQCGRGPFRKEAIVAGVYDAHIEGLWNWVDEAPNTMSKILIKNPQFKGRVATDYGVRNGLILYNQVAFACSVTPELVFVRRPVKYALQDSFKTALPKFFEEFDSSVIPKWPNI